MTLSIYLGHFFAILGKFFLEFEDNYLKMPFDRLNCNFFLRSIILTYLPNV